MLKHGYGTMVINVDLTVFLLMVTVGLILISMLILVYRKKKRLRPAFIIAAAALSSGAFGYSTMASAIPSILLIVFNLSSGSHVVHRYPKLLLA